MACSLVMHRLSKNSGYNKVGSATESVHERLKMILTCHKTTRSVIQLVYLEIYCQTALSSLIIVAHCLKLEYLNVN